MASMSGILVIGPVAYVSIALLLHRYAIHPCEMSLRKLSHWISMFGRKLPWKNGT